MSSQGEFVLFMLRGTGEVYLAGLYDHGSYKTPKTTSNVDECLRFKTAQEAYTYGGSEPTLSRWRIGRRL